MTVALTEVSKSTMVFGDGNKMCKQYNVTLTGTYPNGGYVIDEDAFSGSTNPFSHYLRVRPDQGGVNEDGDEAFISDIDNSDATNPSCNLRILQQATGGGREELAAGESYSSSGEFVLEIWGVDAKGTVGEVN